MPWQKRNPDLSNNPLYLEPRVNELESSVAQTSTITNAVSNTVKYAENFPLIAPETDDTARLQRAINSFSTNEKGVIFLAPKKYNIKSITVPIGVSLVGVYSFDPSRNNGTWFYCTDKVNPALKLSGNQKIEGISFYYPEQVWDTVNSAPTVYPATIQLQMDAKRVLLRDVFFQNSYYAVDADRHHEFLIMENVQGYAFYRGVVMDHSTDVNRLKTVHFNANAWNPNVFGANVVEFNKWTRKNGIAFTIKKTDWSVLFDCFCWGYRTGFLFTSSPNGSPAGVHFLSSGADACGTCIKQDAGWGVNVVDFFFTQFNAFEAGVAVDSYAINIQAATDVHFSKLRCWGVDKHALYTNAEITNIDGCHFDQYGATAVTDNADYRAIINNSGVLNINGGSIKGNNRDRVYGILMQHGTTGATNIKGVTFKDIKQTAIQNASGTDNFIVQGNIYKNVVTRLAISGTPVNYTNFGDITLA